MLTHKTVCGVSELTSPPNRDHVRALMLNRQMWKTSTAEATCCSSMQHLAVVIVIVCYCIFSYISDLKQMFQVLELNLVGAITTAVECYYVAIEI